jgi:hypothetical protein
MDTGKRKSGFLFYTKPKIIESKNFKKFQRNRILISQDWIVRTGKPMQAEVAVQPTHPISKIAARVVFND